MKTRVDLTDPHLPPWIVAFVAGNKEKNGNDGLHSNSARKVVPLSSALCGPCGELLRRDDDAPGVVAWLRMVAVVGSREDFLLDLRSDPPSAHVPYSARGGLHRGLGCRGLHEDAGATLADNPLGPSRVWSLGVHEGGMTVSRWQRVPRLKPSRRVRAGPRS